MQCNPQDLKTSKLKRAYEDTAMETDPSSSKQLSPGKKIKTTSGVKLFKALETRGKESTSAEP